MEPEFILKNNGFESHFDLLGNGRLMARGCYLTSHRPSPDDGVFFFIRNTESGTYWSATPAPVFKRPDSFEMTVGARTARITRQDSDIETHLDILVPLSGDFEIRRLSLANHSTNMRRLEVTSSLDVILLFDRLRDSFHQTFSNMFIGAEFSEEQNALIYHRRFFDNPERFPIFTHRIFVEPPAEFLGFETDREAFIGRGRPFGRPISIDRPLKNTEGYILDPLATLRAGVSLPPETSLEFFFVNSAHFAPEQPETLFVKFPTFKSVREYFISEFENDFSARKNIPITLEELFPFKAPFAPIPKMEENPLLGSPFDETSLLFWNGFGGFDPETHDYRMRICPDRLPPQPWTNILANPDFGAMTTENAIGTTWYKNSKHGRLSPWSNNAVTDPPSEIVFFARKDTEEIWSLTPSPLPASSEYHVVHGKGFTRYESRHGLLQQKLIVSIDPEYPIKYLAIEIENGEEQGVEADFVFFMDAPYVGITSESISNVSPSDISKFLPEKNSLLLNPSYFSPIPNKEAVSLHALLTASTPIERVTFNKKYLFGISGIFSFPKNIWGIDTSPDPISPEDICSAIRSKIHIAPHEKQRITFAVCAGTSEENILSHIPKIQKNISHDEPFSLESVRTFWKQNHTMPSIQTPDESLNILFNTWLPYQTLVSRMWAKMGFYQPGGSFGFRDQLQDTLALFFIDPDITRKHILSASEEQYEDGDVRAWWSPDSDFGVHSSASDHLLWLPFTVLEYIRLSGDKNILNETVSFLTDSSDDSTRFTVRKENQTTVESSLLNHCLRAIDRSSHCGQHGLPLIRSGDWNDGMNRIGHEGKGESVWLGFFLFFILKHFADILSDQGNIELSDAYHERANQLSAQLNTVGWDGHWFLRAFYDDGTPLGSEKNRECRIDAIAQTWSVLSGAGNMEKSREAMENLKQFLYDPEFRVLKLLDPPFNDLTKKNPGYIKDYPPGIRENGSQYNHAVFWAAEAFALLGQGDMVFELLLAGNPIRRSESERKALLYEVEPYVVAADIYSAEHIGKGGWTWYTASAGLMYRTIIETLFGIKIKGNNFSFRPTFPKHWQSCSLTLPRKSGTCVFVFHAKENHTNTIENIILDEKPLERNDSSFSTRFIHDGKTHRYEIFLT